MTTIHEEPGVRVKDDDKFGRWIARDDACEQHGQFEATMFQMRIPNGSFAEGKWLGCPKCAEEAAARHAQWERDQAAQRLLDARVERSGIPARFADATLGSYLATTDAQKRALQVASEYARDFRQTWEDGRSLLMLGNIGCGKTHLAVGIAYEAMRQGFNAKFTTAAGLIGRVKATWGQRQYADAETQEQVIHGFSNVDLLVLDEIGSIKPVGREMEILFAVLGSRHNAVLPTIFTGNLGPEELGEYLGKQVLSRLRESGAQIVAFNWDDYRPTKGRMAFAGELPINAGHRIGAGTTVPKRAATKDVNL